MTQKGPIQTVMDSAMIVGNPDDLKGDQSTAFNGVPGYPTGSGGKIPEVTFVNTEGFSAPKPATKG